MGRGRGQDPTQPPPRDDGPSGRRSPVGAQQRQVLQVRGRGDPTGTRKDNQARIRCSQAKGRNLPAPTWEKEVWEDRDSRADTSLSSHPRGQAREKILRRVTVESCITGRRRKKNPQELE